MEMLDDDGDDDGGGGGLLSQQPCLCYVKSPNFCTFGQQNLLIQFICMSVCLTSINELQQFHEML